MSVIRTDEWLLEHYEDPIALCEKLTKHFAGASAADIYDYFLRFGMYQPVEERSDQLSGDVWEIVQEDVDHLIEEWDGPDIPIYIFPADQHNKWLQTQLGGKSGLAFHDKLFLFISPATTKEEIQAILTHEYNHVCRLNSLGKKEEEYTLLDTIVLEGIAENAVTERLGRELTAKWASLYSEKKIKKLWSRYIHPNQHILRQNRDYAAILYGHQKYPKMLGYCAGYQLVKIYMEKHSLSSKEMLTIEASSIAGGNYV
ncbi:DUF2268 domain-containing protein [Terribacillus saccharophilus]|uniref:DUF2268 domain-containing protein n=1 Tax=Terribacillus saccharophilus TaxID=361277 RepID=UPI003982A396